MSRALTTLLLCPSLLEGPKQAGWLCTQLSTQAGQVGAMDLAGPLNTAACDRVPAPLPRRKRENSLQEDRGSFVTTPTAELSSQEETLLGSFLDWSLDCCSGYEGDQESEGEKEGDGELSQGQGAPTEPQPQHTTHWEGRGRLNLCPPQPSPC